MSSNSFLACLTLLFSYSLTQAAVAQTNDPPSTAETKTATSPSAPTERIVYDPATGRRYRQQVVSVDVPSTQWQTKPVTQTVYEPQYSTRYVNVPRTVYVPRQTYALQAKTRGLWNPFQRPVTAYDYVPTTQWIATVQNQQVPLTSQNWVAKERTYYVSEPVQKNVKQQQVVTTEIPSGLPSSTSPNLQYANQPAPRIRIPLLARQQVIPSALLPSRPPYPVSVQPSNRLAVSPTANSSVSGLRPISNLGSSYRSSTYSAPLRTASRTGNLSRDAMQSGMSATVLR